jgi:hypothetical protein
MKIWGFVARLAVGSEFLLWPISFLTDGKPAIAFLGCFDLSCERLSQRSANVRRASEVCS